MGSLLGTPVAGFRTAVFDLDGTLLTPEHSVDDDTVAALQTLHAQGVTVSIATGRSFPALVPVLQRIQIPRVPVVCYNGAAGLLCCYDEVSGAVSVERELFRKPLGAGAVTRAQDFADRQGCVLQYYAGDDILVNREDEWTRKYRGLTGVQQRVVSDYGAEAPPYKVLVMTGEPRVDEVCDAARRELSDGCHIIRGAPPFFVELLDPGVHKGEGVRNMLVEIGCDPSECVAFGDGDNDLEMLKLVGCGVAMKNARDLVRAGAHLVTERSNAEGGVAWHLRGMLERGEFLKV